MKLTAAAAVLALVLVLSGTAGAQAPPPGVYDLPSGSSYTIGSGAAVFVAGGAFDCAATVAATSGSDVWGCSGSTVPDVSGFGLPPGSALVVGGLIEVPVGQSIVAMYVPGSLLGLSGSSTITVDGDDYGPDGLVPGPVNATALTAASDNVGAALVVVGIALAGVAVVWLGVRLVLRWIYSAGAAT